LAMLKTAEEPTPCTMSSLSEPDSRGLVPAIHVVRHAEKDVDARAFAAPKRLRPRRRDKPGHDDVETGERIKAHRLLL
ncbi:hypothetical protein ACQR1C_31925, partial [Bradyrhizobium oligotrophicum]